MRVHRLENTDAFIVFDLDDAENSIGITRLAPKILIDGATLLARSNTYLFASFEQHAGGASGGINSRPEDRDSSVAAFVAEVEPLVSDATFLTEAGKGLNNAELAPLFAVDPRPDLDLAAGATLLGTSVVVCAERALGASGALSGALVAIEGIDVAHPSVVKLFVERGARIVAFSTPEGTFAKPSGFDPSELVAALDGGAGDAMAGLGGEPKPSGAIFGAEADVLLAGSKAGVVGHAEAASVVAKAVVPVAAVAVTAKAFAVLRHRDIIVMPDFLSAAGPMFASFREDGAGIEEVRLTAADHVGGVLDEVAGHDDGPLLGACYRAEAFLSTWRDTLPFGRPLA